jgi:chromosome segregation ATPase
LVFLIGFNLWIYFNYDIVKKGTIKDKASQEIDSLKDEISQLKNNLQYKDQELDIIKNNKKKLEVKSYEVSKSLEKLKNSFAKINLLKDEDKDEKQILTSKEIVKTDQTIATKQQPKITQEMTAKKLENKPQKLETKPQKIKNEIKNKTQDMAQKQTAMQTTIQTTSHKYIQNTTQTKYKSYTCGSMSSASFHITKECNTKLKEQNQYSDFIINKIEEFAQTGLAQKRVGEAVWTIQTHFKHTKDTKVVNYKLVSKKDFKGFVVRAYY